MRCGEKRTEPKGEALSLIIYLLTLIHDAQFRDYSITKVTRWWIQVAEMSILCRVNFTLQKNWGALSSSELYINPCWLRWFGDLIRTPPGTYLDTSHSKETWSRPRTHWRKYMAQLWTGTSVAGDVRISLLTLLHLWVKHGKLKTFCAKYNWVEPEIKLVVLFSIYWKTINSLLQNISF